MTDKEYEKLKPGDTIYYPYVNGAGNKYPRDAKVIEKREDSVLVKYGTEMLGRHTQRYIFLTWEEAAEVCERWDRQEHERRMLAWKHQREEERGKEE
jgi:hypothetical protein